MANKFPLPTTRPRERAFLVGVELRSETNLLSLEDSLAELTLLADTAGLEVVGQLTQSLNSPNVKTFIGTGKVQEAKALAEELCADVILFDEELLPRHQRELEQSFGDGVRVIDRTALILDIFAQHANTREGSLQVELAQYEYRLPRLTHAWTHLARQAGGGGGRAGSVGGVGLRGPGEKQLEVDRRDINRRIIHLKDELEKIRTHRKHYRARRKVSRLPVVSLVGYTNAGKSTLLNTLTQAGVYTADQLFATLDPVTRRVELPGGETVLFTDTVGFIQKLPTTLVAAFRATLEEIAEADLLLHLVDITHPNAQAQARAVFQTLEEIQADHVPCLTVLNKIDKLSNSQEARRTLENFPNAVAISALTGEGVEDMLQMVSEKLYATYTQVTARLPYSEGGLISLFHELGQVEVIEHNQDGVIIAGKLPGRLLSRFSSYIVDEA
ncbi:MAG: GTPase HflX [Chloroflexota bacterium]